MLNNLHIHVACPRHEGSRLGTDLLHRIQPSIQMFSLTNSDTRAEWDQELLADDVNDLAALKKNEPLSNLVELHLWDVDDRTPTSEFPSIFSRCPNIETLTFASMGGYRDLDMIATVIGKQCPKIRTLHFSPHSICPNDQLTYGIMNALPPQQLTNLEDNGFYADLYHPAATLAIQRHSTTFRKITLGRFQRISRVSFDVIVDNCINLNDLCIDIFSLGEHIDLTQTQGPPWCCTKLRSLTLCIYGC